MTMSRVTWLGSLNKDNLPLLLKKGRKSYFQIVSIQRFYCSLLIGSVEKWTEQEKEILQDYGST